MSTPWRFAGILLVALACRQDRVPPRPDSSSGDGRLSATAAVIPFDSGGRAWRRYVSQKFTPVSTLAFTGAWPPRELVLHETATRVCCQADDPDRTTFTVSAFSDSSRRLLVPIWQTTLVADLADVWSDLFYRAVLYGCCAQSNKIMFASLKSGRTIFVSTDGDGDRDLPMLEVPNTGGIPKRFAAFHDRFTPDDPPEARAAPDLVGVLQYGSLDGPTTRVLLRCPDWAPAGRGVSYQFDSLAFRVAGKDSRQAKLWAANHDSSASALTSFQLHLVLVALDSSSPERQSVLVPITHDSVDIANATVPSACRLSLAAPRER